MDESSTPDIRTMETLQLIGNEYLEGNIPKEHLLWCVDLLLDRHDFRQMILENLGVSENED